MTGSAKPTPYDRVGTLRFAYPTFATVPALPAEFGQVTLRLWGLAMKPWRSIAVLLIALATSGCGAASVIQQHNVEDSQSATDITAAFAAMQEQCNAELKSRRVDGVRGGGSFSCCCPRLWVCG